MDPAAPRKRTLSSSSAPDHSPKRTHSDSEEPKSPSDADVSASHLRIMDSPAEPPASRVSPESPPEYDDVPSPADQLALVAQLRAEDLVVGAVWYIVSRAWFRRFETLGSGELASKEDVVLSAEDVGAIDNADITVDGALKMPVSDGRDVVLVPKTAWHLLVRWYGNAGLEFARQVVNSGGVDSERIEFYPPTFYLVKILPGSSSETVSIPCDFPTPPVMTLSAGSTLRELKIRAAHIFEMDRPVRLWRLPGATDGQLSAEEKLGLSYINGEELTQDGAELVETDEITEASTLSFAMLDAPEALIAIEEQLRNGTWSTDTDRVLPATVDYDMTDLPTAVVKPATMFGGSSFFGSLEAKVPKRASLVTVPPKTGGIGSSILGALTRSKAAPRAGQRGLTGLSNLGNTCFMNSALQCMSNTKELQEYFTSGVHKGELNRDNPLGMGGQVAEAFGQLVERIWSGNGGAVPPREFKQALSKFAPSFSGYGQQDSQELLAFLLDGIHEDLNRIKKKPATNAPDWAGGGDRELVELARTCWEQYRSRNDSVIVDLFQGQYRSTVVCPDCDKVSITFDPFMYVTTNLPVTKKWTGTIYFVPLDPALPRYAVEIELPKASTLKQLKGAIGGFMKTDPKHIILTEEWHGKFFKSWFDEDDLMEIETNKDRIVCFETAAPCPQLRPRYYGKVKPAARERSAEEAALIVVPVLHRPATKKSKFKLSSYSKEDFFGSPLLLTLTAAEASTESGIYRALMVQYARVSKQGVEMMATVTALEAEVAQESPEQSTPDLIPTDAIPAVEPVAADVEPVVDAMVLDETLPTASTSVLPAVDAPDALPSPSVPTPISTAPRKIKPLFKLHVSRTTAASIPLEQNAFSTSTVELEQRATRAVTPDSDIFPSSTQTTLPGSFVTSGSTSEGKRSVDGDAAVEAMTLLTPLSEVEDLLQPLVGTGDFLVAEWDSAALDYFFGSDGKGDQALWDETVKFVDPAVVASHDRKTNKKVITIEDCLHEFTKEERLGEDDTWYCPDCKEHQQATKKVEIWKVPDVLVFALKRFSSSRYSRDKIDDFVDFPIDGFNLESFVEGDKVEKRLALAEALETGAPIVESDSLIYDLYAVDNHYGGLGGGHYTAYAKNHETGKWYDFDDSRVSEVANPNSVKTKAAYLLFYRRRTTRPIGARTRELVESALQSRATSLANSEAGPSVSPSRGSPTFSVDGIDGMDSFNSSFSGRVSPPYDVGDATFRQASHNNWSRVSSTRAGSDASVSDSGLGDFSTDSRLPPANVPSWGFSTADDEVVETVDTVDEVTLEPEEADLKRGFD